MQGKVEFVVEEFSNKRNVCLKLSEVLREKHEIIGVSDIESCFELVPYELVKCVHVYVDEQLRSEVAKREAFSFFFCVKAINNLIKQPKDVFVRYVFLQNAFENMVVDIFKEFLDVAFQNPACFCIVFARFASERTKPIKRLVGSFIDATRI